tara:strand:+ start:1027 stop:1764 length:738 start_codon:yes stop_codon:yes gene_type:complete
MSRYERRLGSKQLSGFINIKEQVEPKAMIQEVEGTIDAIDTKIKSVMDINEALKKVMNTVTDPNVRLIYGHEIRLNTIELNVDCLNDANCEEQFSLQKNTEKEQQITFNSEKINNIALELSHLKINIEEDKKIVETHKSKKWKDIQKIQMQIDTLENDYKQKIANIEQNYIELTRKNAEKILENEAIMQKNIQESLFKEEEKIKHDDSHRTEINGLIAKNKILVNMMKKAFKGDKKQIKALNNLN